MIKPDQDIRPLTNSRIRAVRGELTKNFLVKQGYSFEDLPLGDPGYLLKKIYPHKGVNKKYKVCLIPHHASFYDQKFDEYRKNKDVCVLNIMTNDINELDKIASSEIVVSQSLHGLIFAEAFGIPSVWISSRFDDRWKFKFLDWYSTTNEPWSAPVSLSESLENIIKEARLSHPNIDMDKLTKAFPKDELCFDIDEKIVPYDVCVKIDALKVKCELDYKILNYNKINSAFLEAIGTALKDNIESKVKLYSTPPYIIIGNDVDVISDEEVKRISQVMDSKSSVYFSSIVKGITPPQGEVLYSQNGISFSKGGFIGQNFMLRPIRNIDLADKDFLTFYLP